LLVHSTEIDQTCDNPPTTTASDPVMNDASSLARNHATSATSPANLVEEHVQLPWRPKIGARSQHAASGLPSRSLQPRWISARDNDLGALIADRLRGFQPTAGRATGDQGDIVSEFHRRSPG
jgi:hypothetical protein